MIPMRDSQTVLRRTCFYQRPVLGSVKAYPVRRQPRVSADRNRSTRVMGSYYRLRQFAEPDKDSIRETWKEGA